MLKLESCHDPWFLMYSKESILYLWYMDILSIWYYYKANWEAKILQTHREISLQIIIYLSSQAIV